MRLDFMPIYRRETRAIFQSPALYVMLGLFFFLTGLIFLEYVANFIDLSNEQVRQIYGISQPLNFTESVVRNTFGAMQFLYMFIFPILTMRLIAEEKQSGTFELLVTSPVSDWGIVIGKFLAMMAVNLLIILLSLVYIAFMFWIGQPDGSVIVSCMIGLFLVGVAYSAFGLFASSLTSSQVIAAVVSFVALLLIYLINEFLVIKSSGWLGYFVEDLSLLRHSDNLLKGLIRVEDIAYFILFTFVSLFLARIVLKSRHWRV